MIITRRFYAIELTNEQTGERRLHFPKRGNETFAETEAGSVPTPAEDTMEARLLERMVVDL